uniref:B3 domain-containing protein Os07g0679700-like n=1 Tax=Erigeron canadensis TaxID=72917 RepID=UPI001CB8DAE0|nr:B3 domain-containing protein Os07g0679700-like [Erigeron canadensis]
MSSSTRICMNGMCGRTTSDQWKRGWPMKVGGFATLCSICGTEYEKVHYCERFHLNESGWRECQFCEKPVHCGCIVSKYLFECLDSGGISCMKCIRAKRTQSFSQPQVSKIPSGITWFSDNGLSSVCANHMNNATPSKQYQHASSTSSGVGNLCPSNKDNVSTLENLLPLPTIFPGRLPLPTLPDNKKTNLGSNSVDQQFMGFSALATSNGVVEVRVQEKVPSNKEEQQPPQIVPKSLNSGVSIKSQVNKGTGSGNRASKPHGEGRGNNQLLPKYVPKITEQEMLQIYGGLSSSCTITPLFEKVLSASDAGRVGRLVLPKACAEAYFPAIDHSEGVPVKITDTNGKEWTFQFRYWLNNNSRMYVLEGISPFIRSLKLQAGDTVIFSRLDPENRLVMVCQKAPISEDATALPTTVNGDLICTGNGNSSSNVEHDNTNNFVSVQKSVIQEEKKTRNIGSKSKRLHMHCEDALEIKFTWEEAQDFFKPPPSKPTVVVIENCELEEYDEPPVFGKKTVFMPNASGLQDQWLQCDSCSKWRKLPSDVLIPSKWTCSDNVSDPDRCSCTAAEEIGVGLLDSQQSLDKESKKQKITESSASEVQKLEPNVAVLGKNACEPTTRHPRHRLGCTCIVCMQPPSGKGKHKPNCICIVCSTVRRRFNTLMLRKKQQKSEKESEAVKKSLVQATNKTQVDDGLETGTGSEMITERTNKGQDLDLNCDPKDEEMILSEATNSF